MKYRFLTFLSFFVCGILFLFPLLKSNAFTAMQDRPSVQLQALDKSTARTTTLEAKVGETIEYGSLFIKVQACRESDPLDKPESSAFLQIWEVPLNAKKSEWVFSGWMFSSSPALSAMDHAVYDVWVLKCLGGDPAPSAESTNKVEIKSSSEAGTENELQEQSGLLDAVEEEALEEPVSAPETQEEVGATPPPELQAEESAQPADKSVESVAEDAIYEDDNNTNYE